jgi:uncharacterized protein DUF4440
MKSIIIFITVCIFVVAPGLQAFGEEWTAEQKEVWDSVEGFWDAMKTGDVYSALERHHDKMQNWISMNPYPAEKKQMRSEYNGLVARYRPTFIKLKPMSISIIEDVANVYYIEKWESSNKEVSWSGRVLLTMIKKENNWIWIGRLGSSCNETPSCPYGWK